MLAQHCYNVSGFYDVGPMLFRCGVVGWARTAYTPYSSAYDVDLHLYLDDNIFTEL